MSKTSSMTATITTATAGTIGKLASKQPTNAVPAKKGQDKK